MVVAATLVLSAAAGAEDIEGTVDAVDPDAGTLVIQGTTIHTDERTRYEDGLKGLESVEVGTRLEVDFVRDGDRLLATEIELDEV
ncbi:MAG: hypothetical protein DIU71_06450 [Proteobacteria bacterium]|nr:MAG: hypothetical protein DIU71_06450 [Pseudomonadota bacterium]